MIIGLVGLIGSGKGTVANMFVERGCVEDSFAAPLKIYPQLYLVGQET